VLHFTVYGRRSHYFSSGMGKSLLVSMDTSRLRGRLQRYVLAMAGSGGGNSHTHTLRGEDDSLDHDLQQYHFLEYYAEI
jgi:hypothetical protein